METVANRLAEIWGERTVREKALVIATALVVVVYFNWFFLIRERVDSVWRSHKALIAAETEYVEAARIHNNADAFKKRLNLLRGELESKRADEEEFSRRVQFPLQLEELLEGLRASEGDTPMELVSFDMKQLTGQAATSPDGKGSTSGETGDFHRNSVLLVFRGTYRQTSKYLNEVMDLPRVLSVTSMKMVKAARPAEVEGGRKEKGPIPQVGRTSGSGSTVLETRLEMEVFYK